MWIHSETRRDMTRTYSHEHKNYSNFVRISLISLQEIVTPDVLYEDVVEVSERLVITRDDCRLEWSHDIVHSNDGTQVVTFLVI